MDPIYIKYEETTFSCIVQRTEQGNDLQTEGLRVVPVWISQVSSILSSNMLNRRSSTQSILPFLLSSLITTFQSSTSDFPPCESGKVPSPPDCSHLRLRLTGAEIFYDKWSLPDVALNALSILCVPVTRQMVSATLPGSRSKHVISRASSGRGLDQSVLPFIPERHTRIEAGLKTPKSTQERQERKRGRED